MQVSTHDAFFGNPYRANEYGLQATLGQDMNMVLAGLAAHYELDRLVFAWLMDEIAFSKRGSDVSTMGTDHK